MHELEVGATGQIGMPWMPGGEENDKRQPCLWEIMESLY